jgi:replicative DNA helicase
MNDGYDFAEIRKSVQEAEPLMLEPGGVIFDEPDLPAALWGRGAQVIAARGEPTMIYSPTGIGKTTLAQRVALAAIGIGDSHVLGFEVHPIDGRVLYIAADRPRQAKRSVRRMVTNDDRAVLDERWRFESRRRFRIDPDEPDRLYNLAKQAEARLLVIDSLKDVVSKLSTDESGGAYNDAVQVCVANGVEVITNHHPRKAPSEGRSMLSLDDVYGSAWITAGQGSVIALQGVVGEGVARWRHLKVPAEEVGPFDVEFDYDTGTVKTIGHRDALDYLGQVGFEGATTRDVCKYVTGKAEPTDAEIKRVSRRPKGYENDGYVYGEMETGTATVWVSLDA